MSINHIQKISNTSGNLGNDLKANDCMAGRLCKIGDIDGDGVVDMAASISFDDDGGTDLGALYILTLKSDGTVKTKKKISSTVNNPGISFPVNYRFGTTVSNIGDIDKNEYLKFNCQNKGVCCNINHFYKNNYLFS